MNARKMKRRIYKRHAHTLRMRRLGKQLAAQLIDRTTQRFLEAILIGVIRPFADLIRAAGESAALSLLDATSGRVTSIPSGKAPVGLFSNGISGVWPTQPEAEPCNKPS